MNTTYTISTLQDGTRYKSVVAEYNIIAYGDTAEEAAENAYMSVLDARRQALEAAESHRAKKHQVA
ncbi:MAG TPA: hypothetical protein VHV10_02980 [Ktedonobacteraceae bacterium]|jgi:SHS2 domain-containing protein|nr:hypothetical protein [Ktedonobacteraceae bacterium]